jgi:glycosyltransferase involved in cell wall biosynthesis
MRLFTGMCWPDDRPALAYEDTRMSDRLKVLFVAGWYPSEENPITGIFVREHALAVQRYADVTVACDVALPDLAQPFDVQETIEHGLPTLRLRFRANPARLLRKQPMQTLGAWRIARILKQTGYRPAIVHAHVYTSALPALLMGRAFAVPAVMTAHSTLFARAHLGCLVGWYVRLFVNRMRRVMPVSENLANRLRRHGVRAPMQVVPNTVDLSLFYPGQRSGARAARWRLLTVGLFRKEKGYPYLLEAIAQLRQRRQDFHLDVVGDGELRPMIERRIAELGLGDWVTLHGQLPKPTVAEKMRQADVFVLPSLRETFGAVFAEALASGLPVVATQVGGIPEVVGPEHGRLVPPADPAALSAAIEEVLAAYASYDPQALADSVRRRYSHEMVGAQYEAVYREVLAG